MTELTYDQLEAGLLSIGFTLAGIARENKWFEHPSGALVVYPVSPADAPVLNRHLNGVRVILEAYGLPDPFSAAGVPQKAS